MSAADASNRVVEAARRFLSTANVVDRSDLEPPAADAVRDTPELGDFAASIAERMEAAGGRMAVVSPMSGAGDSMVAACAARWLVREVQAGSLAEDAISRLDRLLSMPAVTGRTLLLAWGPDVPDSDLKVLDCEVKSTHRHVFSPDGLRMLQGFEVWRPAAPAMGMPPTVVIAGRFTTLRPFVPVGDNAAFDASVLSRLYQVASALSLTGCGPVIPACAWCEADDEDRRTLLGSTAGTWGPRSGTVPNTPVAGWPPLRSENAALAAVLLAQPPDRWTRIEIAAERLNRATTSMQAGEAALDIGIALEATLIRSDRVGGIAEQLALRAAWLLASDQPQERERIYSVVRRTYRLRNDFAHGGVQPVGAFDVGGRELGAHDLLREAAEIARQAVVAVAGRSDTPDWRRLLLNALARPGAGT